MHVNRQPSGLFSRPVIRYEVALDVIGAVIAHYAEMVGIERDRRAPDEAKLRQSQAMQHRLRSERNTLDLRDAEAVESAISCYGPLARRLYADPQNDPETVACRAEQFRQANASLALEGMEVDDEDLAIQQLVIVGALSSDEAFDSTKYAPAVPDFVPVRDELGVSCGGFWVQCSLSSN